MLRISNQTLIAALAMCAGALLSTPARAQSLLANGFFDGSASGGWYDGLIVPTYDPAVDGDGDPGSGSAYYSNAAALPTSAGGFSQCVAIKAGNEYFAAGKVRFEPSEVAYGEAIVSMIFYASGNCSGNWLPGGYATANTSDGRGIWHDLAVGDFQSGIVAPPTAATARIQVVAYKWAAGGSLSIHADNLTFAPVGVPICRGLAATIFGTNGPDALVGTAGNDVIVGLAGKDTIRAGGGDDLVCAGGGDDTVYGGGGNDRIYGGGGNDRLRGGAGKDRLFGGAGDDIVRGGAGDDTLVGGEGFDSCYPGTGDDPSEGVC